MKISRAKATDLIKGSKGKTISVTFIKKDGEKRKLNGRLGVHKSKHAPLTGSGLKFTPSEYGLVNIFDMQKRSYRTINTETLTGELKIGGETYEVEE